MLKRFLQKMLRLFLRRKVWLVFLCLFSLYGTHIYAAPPIAASAPQAQPATQFYMVTSTPSNSALLVKPKKPWGFGDLAEEALGPLSALAHFIQAICTIAGIGLFFGSFLQFSVHRKNPAEVRLGRPIIMLLSGLALLLLGFLSYL